ncbi:MAG: hypothetical protein GW822_11420 [Sphingomonadales bacterium]|nr:hypothetical protein [Sphingomonadales bacterium]NCO50336.1 hypothetical protein [Sphingomonadales bacterium]NCP00962.1 hypothetical protein [Sphingomonadales bacterium]NCP28091.1 hypothetical protein [Sphingomonadales bacterium]NCP44029.1 hypothetical protein [Sphingomonadales bacterium]
MRGRAIVLAISMLSLSACEKDFDEKYQDNLEKLQEEARKIESGVDEQLAAGREADKITESANETESPADTGAEASK